MNKEILMKTKDNRLYDLCINKMGLFNRKDEEVSIKEININNFNKSFKRKKVNLILCGEELHAKIIELPKVNYSKLGILIMDELIYYSTDINKIIYNYYILKKHKETLSILINCINSEGVDGFKNAILENKCKLNKVTLIQHGMARYCRKLYKTQDFYITIFMYNSDLYMISCYNTYIVGNSIIRNFSGNEREFNKYFKYLCEKSEEFFHESPYIYFINFNYTNIISTIFNTYRGNLLKSISKRELIKNCLK